MRCLSVTLLCAGLVAATAADAPANPTADAPATTSEVTTDARLSVKPTTFDEVLVVATRTPIASFDAPYATDVVGQEQARRRQYRTTPRALRDVPGLLIQETATGQGSPFIRGFTSQRTVLMVDGIRLNNSVFREGPNQYWATVDALSVDRFEVVRGPSSVLYGSDAIGGAVNALTITPNAYGQEDQWTGRAFYRYHSGEDSHIGRAEFSFALDEDRLGVIVGGTFKDFGDVHGGRDIGVQDTTGYDEYDADVKAEYWINDNTRIVAAHQRVRINNAPRTHRTFDAVFWEGTGPPGTGGSSSSPRIREDFDQERELTYIQLHAEELGDFIDALSVSISHQYQGEVRHRERPGSAPDWQGFKVDTLGIWASLESESPLGRWTYGFEYYRDWVNSFSSRNNIQGPVGDDANYDLLGLYVQNEYDWTERLTTIVGGRFTYARAIARSATDNGAPASAITIEDSYTAFVGSGRVRFAAIPDHVNLFAGVSQGFRAPNLMDLTSADNFGAGGTQVGSPSLDPERYNNFEIGIKGRNEDLRGEITYFYTLIEDQIVRAQRFGVPGVFDVINAGDGHVNGIEAAGAYRFLPAWTLFGNLTWQEGKLERPQFSNGTGVSEQYVSRTSPLAGQVGLRFESEDILPAPVWAEAIVRMAARQDLLAPNDITDNRIPPNGTPGYVVASIYGGVKLYERIELNVGIENLANEDYRIHGSGQNMPGRSVVVSVGVEF
jgi:hemoglobin/transferrin/lactoferrin receptor protein